MIGKKEGMIFVFSFCSVALNALFCLKKRKLRKNKSEVFRVKTPQHKVTKFKTQNHSFFFALSVIPTSIYQRHMVKTIPPILSKPENKYENKKTIAKICNVGARTNARQAFGSQRLSLQIYAIVFLFSYLFSSFKHFQYCCHLFS